MRKIVLAIALACTILVALSFVYAARKSSGAPSASAHLPPAAVSALQKIDPEHIRAHVRFLSHDLLEGRGTGQRGGDIAAEYIAAQFALDGLKPAGDNGTYMQKVPMVGITTGPESTFAFVPSKGSARDLKPLSEYVGHDETQETDSTVNADIVYVG